MGDESRDAQTAPHETRPTQIAIDGAAGVGKSTVGELAARRLGYLYIDSGAFYRALTVLALQRDVAPTDEPALLTLLEAAPIHITHPTVDDGRQYTVLAGDEDITPQIHTIEVARNVSAVARHPEVRTALIERMRLMANQHNVVMVGRDIGMVVLPDANLKIALTAPAEERARRRHADLVADMGAGAPGLDQVLADIEERDRRDAAQMEIAPDAVTIENRDGQINTVVDQICALAAERSPAQPPAAAPTPEPPAVAAASPQPAHSAREGAYVAPPITVSRDVSYEGVSHPRFYEFMRFITGLILPFLLKIRVEGLENVPKSGPVMLASNHVAWIDIPLVSFPVKRITHYMAKIELFHAPVVGWLIKTLGAFPVRRGEGDRESLRTAERLLSKGEVVVIFPEGHRSGGKMIRGLPGVALIALRANTPVVPVGIINSIEVFKSGQYVFRRPTVTIRYGVPFTLEKSGARHSKEDVERGIDTIMTHIAALLPPDYRGVYADALTQPA